MADGPAGFTQDFSCPALLRSLLRFVWLRVLVYHHLWSDFPNASTHHPSCDIAVLQPQRCRNIVGLGSSPFARHYLGNHCLFSLPTGTKMFQFPAFAHHIRGATVLQTARLSHSEIHESKVICTSPGLFAAYHVLLRLQEPRHPPYALSYLFAAPRCRGRCLLKVVLKRLPLLLNKFARFFIFSCSSLSRD